VITNLRLEVNTKMQSKEGILRNQLERMKVNAWYDAMDEKRNRDARRTR